jgi:hypothetical protein
MEKDLDSEHTMLETVSYSVRFHSNKEKCPHFYWQLFPVFKYRNKAHSIRESASVMIFYPFLMRNKNDKSFIFKCHERLSLQ